MPAALVDNFTGQRTSIDLSGTTNIAFEVTADPASSATDRFTVVFGKATISPLPIDITGIRVYPNPVHNGVMSVQMSGMEIGNYLLNLVNANGQVAMSRQYYYRGVLKRLF